MASLKKTILIVVPTYNEGPTIKKNCEHLLAFCGEKLTNYNWKILVADNGSSDNSHEEIESIKNPSISFWHTNQKGRGNALVSVWKSSDADYLTYMDSDLAVDLNDFIKILRELDSGADIVAGSRFLNGSVVSRGIKRELSSRVYIFLVKFLLGYAGTDSQCGFKGIKKDAFNQLLPKLNTDNQIQNSGWFFDTELLVLAQRAGLKIKEIPVTWVEKRNIERKSKVNLFQTTKSYLVQIWNFRKRLRKSV